MDLLRQAFRDIAAGHTRGLILGKHAYIRHLSYADQIGFDQKREEFFEEARAADLPTDELKLVTLRKQRLWDDQKENELAAAKQLIIDLHEGKRKNAHMPSMVAGYMKRIEEAEKDYETKMLTKRRLLELTCEVFAERCVNDYYIMSNLFKDPALADPLFPEEEFDHITNDEVSLIVQDYNGATAGCSEQNVKKLAMQPFFQKYFQLAGDNLTQFFGKPICALTFHQIDLLRWGAHFRNIYGSHDVAGWDKKVLADPDLLTEYANSVTEGKQKMQDQGAYNEGTVVLGAKKEDAKALGLTQQPNMVAEVMKHGGSVTDWLAKRR